MPQLGTRFLGPFRIEDGGRLALREPGTALAFDFRWRACSIEAQLEETRLLLEASVGRVPSTAGPQPRQPVFDMLQALPATLPARWDVHLRPDHRVVLAAERPVEMPLTASALMISITGLLLELAPYLDLLAEAGVGAPEAGGATRGTLNA